MESGKERRERKREMSGGGVGRGSGKTEGVKIKKKGTVSFRSNVAFLPRESADSVRADFFLPRKAEVKDGGGEGERGRFFEGEREADEAFSFWGGPLPVRGLAFSHSAESTSSSMSESNLFIFLLEGGIVDQ